MNLVFWVLLSFNFWATFINGQECWLEYSLTNGQVNIRPGGASAWVSCNEGYTLQGDQNLYCSYGTRWPYAWNILPACILSEIECNSPPDIPHARWQYNNRLPGGVAIYQCDPGFEFSNPVFSQLMCRTSGGRNHQWVGVRPNCKGIQSKPKLRNCRRPVFNHGEVFPSGRQSGHYSENGEYIDIQCHQGFSLKLNTPRITCRDSVWVPSVPICETRECGDPPYIPNGKSQGLTRFPGSTVHYKCDDGYSFKDPAITKQMCEIINNMLEWTGNLPVCIAENPIDSTYSAQPQTQPGTGPGRNRQNGRPSGIGVHGYEKAEIPPENYDVDKGTPKFDEDTSSDDKENPVVGRPSGGTRNQREDPPSVDNGCEIPKKLSDLMQEAPEGLLVASMSSLRFTCKIGYTLEGHSEVKCLNNRNWETRLPKCRKNNKGSGSGHSRIAGPPSGGSTDNRNGCPVPKAFLHGTMLGGEGEELNPEDGIETVSTDSLIRFQCDDEFIRDGPEVVLCQENGKWETGFPTCNESHKNDPSESNESHSQANGGSTSGGSAEHNPGDVPLRVNCPKPTVKNGQVSGSSRSFPPGTKIEIICSQGYQAKVPTGSFLCLDHGDWDQPIPVCEVLKKNVTGITQCPQLTVENGQILPESTKGYYTPGDTVHIECVYGYKSEDASVPNECNDDGTWEFEPRSCEEEEVEEEIRKDICPAPNVEHGRNVPSCDEEICYRPGDVMEIQCLPGFYAVDSSATTLFCMENGEWDQTLPTCEETKCPKLKAPNNGRVEIKVEATNNFYPFGTEAMYTCNREYMLVPKTRFRYCESDGWSGMEPQCKATTCEGLPEVIDGKISSYKAVYLPGEVIEVECFLGYKAPNGRSFFECTAEGTWSTRNSNCNAITCSAPHVDNGIFKLDDEDTDEKKVQYNFMDRISFYCNTGFFLEGKKQHYCNENGWSGPIPVCTEVLCPKPIVPSNGLIQNNNPEKEYYTFGETVVFQCDQLYKLEGSTSRTCTNRGWSGLAPECKLNGCSNPEPPKWLSGVVFKFRNFARQNAGYSYFNTKLEVVCPKGYKKSPNNEAVCQPNGKWSDIPECIEILCNYPKFPENGYIEKPELSLKLGTKFTSRCNPGYNLVGEAVRTCVGEGWWNGKIPKCEEILCNYPKFPKNGYIEETDLSLKLGTKFTNRCNRGYKLVGEAVRTCHGEGWWDGRIPECRAIVCNSPPGIENGKKTSQWQFKYYFGSIASYKCHSGFELVPSDGRLTCTEEGWTGELNCQEAQCYLSEEMPSMLYRTSDVHSYQYANSGDGRSKNFPIGTKLFFSCKGDFVINGDREAVCLNTGSWSTDLPSCGETQCYLSEEMPSILYKTSNVHSYQYADGRSKNFPIGTKLFFSCEGNLAINGDREAVCLNTGSWSTDLPTCGETQCYLSKEMPSVLYRTSDVRSYQSVDSDDGRSKNFPIGTKLFFRCKGDLVINGDKEAVCLNPGSWSTDLPTCEVKYCTKPNIKNSAPIGGHFRYQARSQLGIQCQQGFRANENTTLTCLPSGQWSSTSLQCQEIICILPSMPYFGEVKPRKAVYSFGETVKYNCLLKNFRLSGNRLRTCTENGWNGTKPACTIVPKHNLTTCGDPPLEMPSGYVDSNDLQQGKRYNIGDRLTTRCNEGYRAAGPKEDNYIICSPDGTWSHDFHRCLVPGISECPTPPEITNGKLVESKDSYLIGDHVVIACERGFRAFNGSDYLICLDTGHWDEAFANCKTVWCDPPEIPPHIIIEHNDIAEGALWPYNSEISFKCSPGYQLVGDRHWMKCQQHGWSSSVPQCQNISCIDPGTPEYGYKTGDKFKVGEKVQFECFTGYQLVGPKERLCMQNGQWSEKQPFCQVSSSGSNWECPGLAVPTGGMKVGTNYMAGGKMSFSCSAGYSLIGSEERICMNEAWTGTEAQCVGKYEFQNPEDVSRAVQSDLRKMSEEQIKHLRCVNKQRVSNSATRVKQHLVVYIVLDASSSIGATNFQRAKNFSKALVQKLSVSVCGTRVGLITFSSKATAEFYPSDFHSAQNIIDAIDKVPYHGGGTSVQAALEILKDMIQETMDSEDGLQGEVARNQVFLLTDGKFKKGTDPVSLAKNLKEEYATNFTCIAVTGFPDKEVLFSIADDVNHVFFLESFSTLDWITLDILDDPSNFEICGRGMDIPENPYSQDQASTSAWPWTALISKERALCQGSLISSDWVLTAASCVFEKLGKVQPRRLKIRLGSDKRTFDVAEIILHPQFSSSTNVFNAALLRLKLPVLFRRNRRSICLPPSLKVPNSKLYRPDENAYLSALSPAQEGGKRNLQNLLLSIKEMKTCFSSAEDDQYLNNTFCAQDKEEQIHGDGNIGSALIQYQLDKRIQPTWSQVGITSAVGENGYAYFTDVSRIVEWIKDVTTPN